MSPGSSKSFDTVALTVTGAAERPPSVAVTVKLAVAFELPSLTNSTEPAASWACVKLVIAVVGALDSATWPWTGLVTVNAMSDELLSASVALRSAVVSVTALP